MIVPYKRQAEVIRRELRRRDPALTEDALITRIATVDSFQGSECDAIIISLVRSNDDQEIGFLKDIRRMNVAMTRARKKLIIIGDGSTIAAHPFYKGLASATGRSRVGPPIKSY